MIKNDIVKTLPKKAAQLVELLSDFQPRTTKQIRQSFPIANLAGSARKANELLKTHSLEIQKQLHPRQSDWHWLLVELKEGGRNYAG